ncbi:MAG: hypothetical protein ACPGRW_06350 [Flavobacteriaceae bacterium]
MAITRIQEAYITIGTPVEIDAAVNSIREALALLPWVSHPYLIAQRFVHKSANGKSYLLPEVYSRRPTDTTKRYSYKPLTPDNDFTGMFFAYVDDGEAKTNDYGSNYITYKVAFIFMVNLKLIDSVKLNNGLFTRELMSEARKVINKSSLGLGFESKIIRESNDLKKVFREFNLEDAEAYNRAPLQCFRFDLYITIQEDCI